MKNLLSTSSLLLIIMIGCDKSGDSSRPNPGSDDVTIATIIDKTLPIKKVDKEKTTEEQPPKGQPQPPKGPRPLTPAEVASAAQKILEEKCAFCHNLNNAQGGFSTVMNTQAMIDSGRFLIPGKPESSVIYTRLAPQGNMPVDLIFSQAEKTMIQAWIINLGKTELPPPIDLLTDAEQLAMIRKDLETTVLPADRPTTRYFSLQVAHNRGRSSNELKIDRQSFIKVINSLSLSPKVLVPKSIDSTELIYRINLNDINMPANRFRDAMRDFYPYNIAFRPDAANSPASVQAAADYDAIVAGTTSSFSVIRMDWFNATAVLPTLYDQFLDLTAGFPGGNDVSRLEDNLGVSSSKNITENLVMRSGFKNSGVSSNNRVLERHLSSTNRYYWLSYDFFESLDNQNILANPLGPNGIGFNNLAFAHDGGEVIFELPNGFMGFFLETSAGLAIEKGPQGIVRNAEGPAEFVGAIINGISCFSCHAKGMLDKKDQVRDFAATNITFSQAEKDKINALYTLPATFTKAIKDDSQRYMDAQKAAGLDPALPDPVTPSFRQFYSKLSRADVVAELGISLAELDTLLLAQPFDEDWANLKLQDGVLIRREFNLLYGRALERIKGVQAEYLSPQRGDYVLTQTCMNVDAILTSPCIDPTIAGANRLQ